MFVDWEGDRLGWFPGCQDGGDGAGRLGAGSLRRVTVRFGGRGT